MYHYCISQLVFPSHLFKIVVELNTFIPPHIFKLWLGVIKGMIPVKTAAQRILTILALKFKDLLELCKVELNPTSFIYSLIISD